MWATIGDLSQAERTRHSLHTRGVWRVGPTRLTKHCAELLSYCQCEQDGGGSWSTWDRFCGKAPRGWWAWKRRARRPRRVHPARGKTHSAPFSLAYLLKTTWSRRGPRQPCDPEKSLSGPPCLFSQPGMRADSPGATAIWTLGTLDQPKQCGGGLGPAEAAQWKPPTELHCFLFGRKPAFLGWIWGPASGEDTLISAGTSRGGGRGQMCVRSAVLGGCHRG